MSKEIFSRRQLIGTGVSAGAGLAASFLTARSAHAASAPSATSESEASGMKMIVLFRRKQALTPDQFREYYETRHAPLALQLFPYMKSYRRNYIRHDLMHRRAGGEAINAPLDFDVITEITFANKSDYDRMVSDMSDPAVREQVVADEMRFLDRSATVVFMVDEATTARP